MRCAAMTLGAHGSLALMDGRFHYSPGFVVSCLDTTGAGDIFHGAFCYSVVRGFSLDESLEFSNSMAALNCMAMGARGGIADEAQARALMVRGERRVQPEFARYRN
jgi:sulfofructose kinase